MIAKAFLVCLWACLGIFLIFMAIPWLINQQNDGLIILAPLTVFSYGAVSYILWNTFKEAYNEDA